MSRFAAILVCAGLLAGCASTNTAIHNLQFSGETEAFPANYNERAAKYVANLPVAGSVTVSYPELSVGETALSPKRWYVCVRGLTPPIPPPTGLAPVLEVVDDMLRPRPASPTYELILVLRASGTTSAIRAFDSPLCRAGRYESLRSEPD